MGMRSMATNLRAAARGRRLYVSLVIIFAVSNFVFHLRLGMENFEDHSAYACLWTATGWPTMFLTRVAFENGSSPMWPVLPAGLITYGLLWSPILFTTRDRPWYWRTILIQLGVLTAWIAGYVLLGPLTYHFRA